MWKNNDKKEKIASVFKTQKIYFNPTLTSIIVSNHFKKRGIYHFRSLFSYKWCPTTEKLQ